MPMLEPTNVQCSKFLGRRSAPELSYCGKGIVEESGTGLEPEFTKGSVTSRAASGRSRSMRTDHLAWQRLCDERTMEARSLANRASYCGRFTGHEVAFMRSIVRILTFATITFLAITAALAQEAPKYAVAAGDYVAHDFKFKSGEQLPQLRLHYQTLGKPARDSQGRIANAVLILHGTGGSGQQFLQPQFADQLFGTGQLLDINHYFIILPDG